MLRGMEHQTRPDTSLRLWRARQVLLGAVTRITNPAIVGNTITPAELDELARTVRALEAVAAARQADDRLTA